MSTCQYKLTTEPERLFPRASTSASDYLEQARSQDLVSRGANICSGGPLGVGPSPPLEVGPLPYP